MALITCVDCGGKLSDKAEACPHCGCPVEASLARPSAPAVKAPVLAPVQKPSPPKQPAVPDPADPDSLLDEIARIENKAKQQHTRSFWYGGGGIAVIMLGGAVGEGAGLHVVGKVLTFAGLLLFCTGVGLNWFLDFYARKIEKLRKQLDRPEEQPTTRRKAIKLVLGVALGGLAIAWIIYYSAKDAERADKAEWEYAKALLSIGGKNPTDAEIEAQVMRNREYNEKRHGR